MVQTAKTISDEELDRLIAENTRNQYAQFQDQKQRTIGLQTSITERPEQIGGETLLGRIIDVLSRGEYASAGLAKDYILGQDFNPESVGETVKKGALGREKITYPDLMPHVFPEWSPWKQKAVGFGLSIFADPTSYMGTILKLPLKAGKRVLKAAPFRKAGKVLDESLVGKAFKPGAGLPEGYYELKYYAQKALEAEQHKVLEGIDDLRSGLSRKEMEFLSYLREHPLEAGRISPKLKQKLEVIGQRFDALVDDGVKTGLITPDIAKQWKARETPYVPHYYPERKGGVKIAKGEIPPSLFEKAKGPTFLKKRTYETLEDVKKLSADFDSIANAEDMDEALELIAAGGVEDAFGKIEGMDLDMIKGYAKMLSKYYKPEENILRALAWRSLEQVGFNARKKFVDDVLNQFGQKVKAGTKVAPEGHGLYLPKGAIRFYGKDVIDSKVLDKFDEMIPKAELEEFIKNYPSVTKKVPTYMLPESIAKDMNRGAALMYGDPATGAFWSLFDKVQNTWKQFATTVRLPFHARNMYSNWFQAYLAGVNSPKRFLDALNIQAKATDVIKLGKKTYKADDLREMISQLGVRGRGWLAADVPIQQAKELESLLKYGKLRKATPFRIGRKFGSFIEDNARIAVFLEELAKGKTGKEASQTVRKYLFDYTELTDFEKKVMRRIWPFYTWTRKNAPLQIENLLTQPLKYQRVYKGKRALAEREAQSEAELKPNYFNELLYIKSPMKTKQGKPIYMAIDLPPNEFNRVTSPRHWVSALTPWKLPLELFFNFKTFPEISPISKNPLGERTRAPMWVPWLPKKMLEAMHERNIIGPVLNKRAGRYELGMDKKWVHGLQNAFPFLNELNRIYAQPVTLSDESPKMKMRSYLTGISHTALDESLLTERELFRAFGETKYTLDYLDRHGTYPTPEQLEKLRSK